MIRWMLLLFGGALLGGVVHLGTIILLPRTATQDAYARLIDKAPVNTVTALAEPKPASAVMPYMDPAFAGGVCRCRHCGAIQTVPSHLKKGKTPSETPPKPGRTLFTRNPKAQAAAAGTVRTESPVIATGRLDGFKQQLARFKERTTQQKAYIVGGAVVAVGVVAAVVWMMVR